MADGPAGGGAARKPAGSDIRSTRPAPNKARDQRRALSERALKDADDAALGAAIVGRDEGALARALPAARRRRPGLARRVLGDRTLAEEVVQEVFVRTWNAPDRFDAERGSMRVVPARAGARPCRSTCCVPRTARRAREQRDALRHPTVDDDLEREVMRPRRSRNRAATRSRRWPKANASAIELAYFGGHTYREVAVMLEQPEGTVKSRIRSGLLRLRAALIDAGVHQ